MKFLWCCYFLFLFISVNSSAQQFPIWNSAWDNSNYEGDWMITPVTSKAAVYESTNGRDVIISNGLVKRSFRITPNLACFDYKNLVTGQQLLRAIKPEARLVINGKAFNVGGLYGQKENAYLQPSWLEEFSMNSSDFRYKQMKVSDLKRSLNWKSRTKSTSVKEPTGIQITFEFISNLPELAGLIVTISYQLYDGLPLISKQLTLENKSTVAHKLDTAVHEILGMVEEESAVVGSVSKMKKPQGMYFETNYAFNNAMNAQLSDQTTHWKADSTYTSQVNYNFTTPCLLEIYPHQGIGIELKPGEIFNSPRTYELAMDSYDRERQGLAIRRMYQTIAPWTSQNPIFMHLVSKNDQEVKEAIDQCVATGYEAVILSFGSHCKMEDISDENVQRWKSLTTYAHSKGILIGSYSLFSSRHISDEDDVVNPLTGKPGGAFFGFAPCYGSNWGIRYLNNLKLFISKTGFDIFENDGPYPGDVCASTKHPGHIGLADSQWKQLELQKSLYHWCSENGVYVNAPDWYFLDGTNKIALGYREVNFSLPRDQQIILNRQNIYDGTWSKTPSMGWGFVPLTKYQGGGPEAVLEPLEDHLKEYEQLMMQYYGAGVQACYRGPRLFDTEKTRVMVSNTIQWYKIHREILNSDIIHLRRADGRDWDGWLHVNPQLKTKGLIMLFNPLSEPISRNLSIPLYYSGLKVTVTVIDREGVRKNYTLNAKHELQLGVTIPAEGYLWLTVEE